MKRYAYDLAFAAYQRRRDTERLARAQRETSEFIGRHGVGPALEIVHSDQLTYRWDAIFRRVEGGYRLELPAMAGWETLEKASFLGSTYLYWLMQCPPDVEKIVVNLSDGDQPTVAQFSPSTNQPHVTPLPDPFFFLNSAYDEQRQLSEEIPVPWESRTNEIVWRGTSSGIGSFDPILGAVCPSRATQRILLCMAAKGIEGVDIALSAYLRDEFKPEILRQHGFVRDHQPERSWLGRKFAVDVDGQTNTWSNLIVRLHFGCCVLKIDSREGYRQWYYDRLRPWEHFVPVKADMSDFREQVEWLRSHDAEAKQIAANGQTLARTLTFDAARREAVELIRAHWQETMLV